MAIQISSELLDGCVLACLKGQDYYGYALTQRLQAAISVSESTLLPSASTTQEKMTGSRLTIRPIKAATDAIIRLRAPPDTIECDSTRVANLLFGH